MSDRRESVLVVGLAERPSLVVGVVVAVLGVVFLFVPELAAGVPGNRLVVLLVALVALLAGVKLLQRRRGADRTAVETGDPEVRMPLSTPGTDLQRRLDSIASRWRAPVNAGKRLRKRLFDAAVAAVRRHERVSPATAEGMVAAGEWTDDAHAAVFLSEYDTEVEMSRRERIRAALSLEPRVAFEARRTAEAILDLADPGNETSTSEADTQTLHPGPATDDRTRPYDRETERWAGVGALALLAGAVGIGLERPNVLLLSVVGVTYAAFAFRATPPGVDLVVERTLTVVEDGDWTAGTGAGADAAAEDAADDADVSATPGDVVAVTLTVANRGDHTLSDLRLVDGVPPALEVLDGSPRLGTALRPGRSATYTYTVEATRGDHEFGPLQVLARDAAGANEREVAIESPGRLTCLPALEDVGSVPLHGTATQYTGRVATETGGEGVEFYATREYRPGDPPGRIDWNRHARTRELSTLVFREERAATVVLLVDTRDPAFHARGPGEAHAVDRSVDAAGQVFESLLDGGDRVGLASFGPRACWVDPGAGTTHRERVRRTLATDPAFSYEIPDGTYLPRGRLAEIRRRAPVDAQFVLFSPLLDDHIETVSRQLKAHGFPLTVVSPDVTSDRSLGQRLVQVERRTRLNALREADIRVVDWRHGEELVQALDRSSAGWSR